MSDLPGGSGDNPEIKFIIDTSDSKKAIIDMTALGQSVKASMKDADASIKLVSQSLSVMVANARSNLEQLKAATAKAQADSRTRIIRAETKKGVDVSVARAEAKIKIDLSEQALVKLEQHQKRLTQTNKANTAIRVSNTITANKQILQSSMIVHQQQMQASKASQAAHTANAKVAVAAQKQIQAAVTATGKVQAAIISSNSKAAQAAAAANLSSQNHQQRIAMAAFQQQNRMMLLQQRQAGRTARQGGGQGGWGAAWGTSGLLQGLGTVGKALGGGGGAGLLGGLVGLGAGSFAGGAIVGQITAVVKNLTDAAAAADTVTAAYSRQAVAARSLAGSQGEVNELLQVYSEATGGVLSKQQQLEGVTKLLSVGFADSAKEIEQAAKSIRGISLATGRPQDAVENDLILEMFTQRGQRLDQLGLQYDVVRKKTNELMAANSSLTKQQAYQNAVLDHAMERYGALADSAAGQATEVERLAAAYDNLGLAISESVGGPIDFLAKRFTIAAESATEFFDEINRKSPDQFTRMGDVEGGIWGKDDKNRHSLGQARSIQLGLEMTKANMEAGKFSTAMLGIEPTAERIAQEFAEVNVMLKAATNSVIALNAARVMEQGLNLDYSGPDPTGSTRDVGPTADQIDEMVSFAAERRRITADADQAILDENRSYFRERARVERDYQEQVSEEAADFARKRARDNAHFAADLARAEQDMAKDRLKAQEDLADDIARMTRDHNRRLAEYAEDLQESIADANKQARKRTEDAIEDFNEKQLEAREDSAKRILEIEEDFKKQQKRAAEDHNDAILDAASRLDAAAVYQEQRDFARKQRQAEEDKKIAVEKEKEKLDEQLVENKEAQDKLLAEIQENLKEEIEEQNKAHLERVADANEAHALQLADQQAAAADRLEEQGLEDAERLQDMKDAHILRQSEEDIDRGIRLGKDETHHNAQLLEMNRVHGERITQIGEHATAELTALNTAHNQRMIDLNFANSAWQEAENRATAIALEEHKKYLLEDKLLRANARKAIIEEKIADAAFTGEDLGPLQDALKTTNEAIEAIGDSIETQQGIIDALPKPEDVIVRIGTGGPSAAGFSPTVRGEGGVYDKVIPGSITGMGGNTVKTSNIRVDAGAIVINAPPGMSAASIYAEFDSKLLTLLNKVAASG